MFKIVLIAALVALAVLAIQAQAQDYRVKIEYSNNTVHLTVHVPGNEAGRVTFHYGLRTTNHQGTGTRNGENYELRAPLLNPRHEPIHANAQVHLASGLSINTPTATLNATAPA